jgi:hypothetical protein
MAKVPGDALADVSGIAPVVAFTPPEAERAMAALAPPGFRLLAQRGDDLGTRLTGVIDALLAVSLLPPWFDVDTAEDLARLRAELAGRTAPTRTARFVSTLAC